jgi:hypothetical protein
MEDTTIVRFETEVRVLVELNHVQRMNDGDGFPGFSGEFDCDPAQEEVEVADVCLVEPLNRAVKVGCLDGFEVAPRGVGGNRRGTDTVQPEQKVVS